MIFDRNIPVYVRDVVLIANLFKAIKRALIRHIDTLSYSSEVTFKIFNKPLVKIHVYYLALMYFYQSKNKNELRENFSTVLNKIAPPKLIDEFEDFFPKVVSKTRKWYILESNNFKNDVSNKKFEEFLKNVSVEIGVDLEGSTPFTKDAIDWSK